MDEHTHTQSENKKSRHGKHGQGLTRKADEKEKTLPTNKLPYVTSRLISSTTHKYICNVQIFQSKLAAIDFNLSGSLKVNSDNVVGLPILNDFLLMLNSNIYHNSAPLRHMAWKSN